MGPKDIFDALLNHRATLLLLTGSLTERVICGSSRLILASGGSAATVCLIQFRSKKFVAPEKPISHSKKAAAVEATRDRPDGTLVARWKSLLHQGM